MPFARLDAVPREHLVMHLLGFPKCTPDMQDQKDSCLLASGGDITMICSVLLLKQAFSRPHDPYYSVQQACFVICS